MPAKKRKKVSAKITPAKRTGRPAKRRSAIPAMMPRIASKPAKMRLAAPAPELVAPAHESIARRAFEIWQTNLRLANDSLRNWLEAERQLRAELNEGDGG